MVCLISLSNQININVCFLQLELRIIEMAGGFLMRVKNLYELFD